MTLKCSDSDVAQWKRVRLITGRSVDQNHPSLLYKILTVDLSEWSKEPGLGPGMFACAGSNPVINILKLL